MCTRYWTDESPELRAIVEEMNRSPLVRRWKERAPITAFGEVRPTSVAPVVAPDRYGNRAVFPMKWGFSGKSLLLNARSETAAQKPTFREAWARHRCIVPASGYFEWEHYIGKDGRKHAGKKYRIRPAGSSMTWLCGLYRIEEGLPVFVILTREPGEEIRFIHDRMPLIMPDRLADTWISPRTRPEELLPHALTAMTADEAD